MTEAPLDLSFDVGGLSLDLDAFAGATSRGPENRYILPKPFKKVKAHAVKYDRAADLVEDMGDAILAGETVHALLSGNFIYGDLFEALAVEKLAPIDDLTLSTLSFGQENVDSLAMMLETGWLKTLNIVVSDYFWSHNRHNAKYIFNALDVDDRFQFAVAGTHTKIALLKIGERKIVAHGSANLRSSRSVESVTFETCPELYDFHMAWHQTILDEHRAINKSIRASKLFDKILKNTKESTWRQK